jgi:hypothetical protein
MLYHHCFSTLEYVNSRVQEDHGKAETHRDPPASAYAQDVNIVGENTNTIKNTEALLGASKKVGLEVTPQRTKHILMSHSQKTGQKHSIKVPNMSFEDVVKFKYLGTTLTDQNWMHEEIKSSLNSGNLCYHSTQSFVFPPAVYERKG